jgi:hypothetical protein
MTTDVYFWSAPTGLIAMLGVEYEADPVIELCDRTSRHAPTHEIRRCTITVDSPIPRTVETFRPRTHGLLWTHGLLRTHADGRVGDHVRVMVIEVDVARVRFNSDGPFLINKPFREVSTA